jgi:hypothetical protein
VAPRYVWVVHRRAEGLNEGHEETTFRLLSFHELDALPGGCALQARGGGNDGRAVGLGGTLMR